MTAASLFASSGCGNDVPSVDKSTAEAKVAGTVKVHGQTAKGGEVMFDATNAARKESSSKTAKIKDDGTYEITTFVGHNTVKISGPAVKKEPMLGYSSQTIEVKHGENKIDLDFPPTPK